MKVKKQLRFLFSIFLKVASISGKLSAMVLNLYQYQNKLCMLEINLLTVVISCFFYQNQQKRSNTSGIQYQLGPMSKVKSSIFNCLALPNWFIFFVNMNIMTTLK
jgi:hypothetical protein